MYTYELAVLIHTDVKSIPGTIKDGIRDWNFSSKLELGYLLSFRFAFTILCSCFIDLSYFLSKLSLCCFLYLNAIEAIYISYTPYLFMYNIDIIIIIIILLLLYNYVLYITCTIAKQGAMEHSYDSYE